MVKNGQKSRKTQNSRKSCFSGFPKIPDVIPHHIWQNRKSRFSKKSIFAKKHQFSQILCFFWKVVIFLMKSRFPVSPCRIFVFFWSFLRKWKMSKTTKNTIFTKNVDTSPHLNDIWPKMADFRTTFRIHFMTTFFVCFFFVKTCLGAYGCF